MSALLHRALVAVTGQPDDWETARAHLRCTGHCEADLACECEMANTTPLRPRSMVLIRPAITVHRIPLARRVRRLLRDLVRFFSARRFRL